MDPLDDLVNVRDDDEISRPPGDKTPGIVFTAILVIFVLVFYVYNWRSRREREDTQPLNESQLREKRLRQLRGGDDKPQQQDKRPSQSIVVPPDLSPRKWTPLTTLEDLWAFSPTTDNLSSEADAAIPIPAPRHHHSQSLLPSRRLMAVHDMAGNYGEDSFVDGFYVSPGGGDEGALNKYAYVFSNFASIDSFIYFSHELVSIPPRGWIDAGHRAGSLVLGAFLTEWDKGKATCDSAFASRESALRTSRALEAVRAARHFDGWLINIENPLPLANLEHLLAFLRDLSSTCRNVIWYDSVVFDTGELKWQNCLNARNVAFFEAASGGIFTNYGWREEQLRATMATASAFRGPSVWHGIDVWGRGSFGGGGMACNLALDLITRECENARDASGNAIPLRAALFAPGWTLENAAQGDYERFLGVEEEFWTRIAACGWPDFGSESRVVVSSQAFFTDFCQGGGTCVAVEGRVVYRGGAWIDMRRFRLQPRLDSVTSHAARSPQEGVVARVMHDGPLFSGAQAVRVFGRLHPSMPEGGARRKTTHRNEVKLLSCDCRLEGAEAGDYLEIAIALHVANGDLSFYFELGARDGANTHHQQQQHHSNASRTKRSSPPPPTKCYLIARHGGSGYACSSETLMGGGWRVRRWRIKTAGLRGRRVTGIGCRGFSPAGLAWLDCRVGMISLRQGGANETRRGRPVRMRREERGSQVLVWECDLHEGAETCTCWEFIHIFLARTSEDEVYLTTAFGRRTKITSIMLTEGTRLVAMPIGSDGFGVGGDGARCLFVL